MEIKAEDVFNKDKLSRIKEFIDEKSKDQSTHEKIELLLLSIEYKLKDIK